jgi:hypothetical protein
MEISRRNFLRASLGAAAVWASSGLWIPKKARAGQMLWQCNWDYTLGSSYQAVACGPGAPPWNGYDYTKLNPQKWHDVAMTGVDYAKSAPDPSNDYLEVVNNPPVGCPTPNAIKISWKMMEQVTGSWLRGTDGQTYACRLGHTSSSNDRPVTGANWKTYWQPDEYKRITTNTWQLGRQYYTKNVAISNTCGFSMYAVYPWAPNPPYNTRWEMSVLPNPFYHRFYYYSESWADYAEAARKLAYWKGPDGTKVSMLEAYNMNNLTNPSLPLPPNFDHRGFLVVHKRPAVNLSRMNLVDDEKQCGLTTFFGGSGQPKTAWPPCPETGAWASQGILETNKWHCIEFAHYSHHTNGWIRVWLDGKLCIHCCKEAWGVSSYDTLAHTTDGVDRYHECLVFPHERNGGPVKDSLEYTAAHAVSGSYIGPLGTVPTPTELLINKQA